MNGLIDLGERLRGTRKTRTSAAWAKKTLLNFEDEPGLKTRATRNPNDHDFVKSFQDSSIKMIGPV